MAISAKSVHLFKYCINKSFDAQYCDQNLTMLALFYELFLYHIYIEIKNYSLKKLNIKIEKIKYQKILRKIHKIRKYLGQENTQWKQMKKK